MPPTLRALLTLFVSAAAAQFAGAQGGCLDWRPGFHLPGADQDVRAMVTFADGISATPSFYIGGSFNRVNQTAARRIAKWDGTDWTEVGGGLGFGQSSPAVRVLHVHDDGSGVALYVGGSFSNVGDAPGIPAPGIARWNGTQWSSVGLGISGDVTAMATYDDGSGPKLWVGGTFQTAGGVPATGTAMWDGTNWSMGSTNVVGNDIEALVVHDDGTGPALYASFNSNAVGPTGTRVAKLVGSTWTALPAPINGTVNALASWDDGTGLALYAAGRFSSLAGTNASRVAKWNGTAWSSVGGGVANSNGTTIAYSLRAFDDGTGSQLYVTGAFTSAGGVPASGFARWNGTMWSALESGIASGANPRLGLFDDGTPGNAQLVLGGSFNRAGGFAVQGLAAWNGTYSTFGPGVGTTGAVSAITIYDDGAGPALYMGGFFDAAGGAANVRQIGRWTGTNLTPLGAGTDGPIYAQIVHDDGSGRQLYAGGQFTSMDGLTTPGIARWNGTTWSAVGAGLQPRVGELFEHDDGAGVQLFAITTFPPVKRWNGTVWSDVAWDPLFGLETTVIFDDGAGPELYASGTQSFAGGGFERRVARLDGNTWTAIGGAFDFVPDALCVYDDGSGPKLHAFGPFTDIGGQPVRAAARWDGTAWIQLGTGLGNTTQGGLQVFDALVWDDHTDSRPLIYVVGQFTEANGSPVSNIAAWDGTTWLDVGAGTDARIEAICVFEQPGGPDLYVGGLFTRAGDTYSYRLARFSNSCSPLVGLTGCFGDGSGAPCPCANQSPSIARGGCTNSLGVGAQLRAVGKASASLDSFALQASGMPNSAVLYFQGTSAVNGGAGAPFGDGLRCVGGSIRRLGTKFNNLGSSNYPEVGEPSISERGGIGPFGVVTRYYQGWYRNAASFCSPSTFNLTNAIEVFWIP